MWQTLTSVWQKKARFDKKWLTDLSQEDVESKERTMNGLGFHIPGMFNRIVDIDHCYLQKDFQGEVLRLIQ